MSIGTKAVCHIALLVKDLAKAVKNWSMLLGIDDPKLWTYPEYDQVPSFTHGEPTDNTDTKFAVFQLDNIILELVQPGDNPKTPYREGMDRDGEGLEGISFVVKDRHAANQVLKEMGAPKPYHIGYFPDGTYAFVDTREQLGIEINIKTDDDNTKKIPELKADPTLHLKDFE